MAESSNIESGQRFMLSSGDKIHPEDWGTAPQLVPRPCPEFLHGSMLSVL